MTATDVERIRACEVRIDGLGEKVDRIEGKLDMLMTNHLPHLERKIAWIGGGIAVLAALVRFAPIIIAALK